MASPDKLTTFRRACDEFSDLGADELGAAAGATPTGVARSRVGSFEQALKTTKRQIPKALEIGAPPRIGKSRVAMCSFLTEGILERNLKTWIFGFGEHAVVAGKPKPHSDGREPFEDRGCGALARVFRRKPLASAQSADVRAARHAAACGAKRAR